MGTLTGKVAAVTGGASGIGEATVRRFVKEGAAVAIGDRDKARGERVAAELKAQGAKVIFVEADVAKEAACQNFIQKAVAEFGRLDILVNNAGIRLYQTVVEASEESWDQILAVNLKSYAFCSKAAIPVMARSGGGTIVNLSSVRSITTGGGTTQYETTKGAVAALTRGMAMDHAGQNIRVNAVCPGHVFTPFHANRIAAAGKSVAQYNDEAAKVTMLKRPGTSDEIANCILFLASEESSYVTGAALYVDGGWTAI